MYNPERETDGAPLGPHATIQTQTRSGRVSQVMQRLIEVVSTYVAQDNMIPGELFCRETLFP